MPHVAFTAYESTTLKSDDLDPQIMTNGKISTIIPVKNGVRFIADSVCSAARQTWPDVEVIVIDDGSSDGTVRVVESLELPNVKLLTATGNGACAARNQGLAAATGDFKAPTICVGHSRTRW